jgi:UDP-N-acetyl-D-mannosaminuronic acid transferase (WecB/TagA/CpsF family)
MSYTNPGPSVTTGSTDIGLGSPQTLGTTAASLIAFYGATPIVQPTSAAQTALTAVTAVSGAFGFATSAALTAFVAQVENIRASLVLLGLLKGS